MIYAVDPGYEHSAVVILHGRQVVAAHDLPNEQMLTFLTARAQVGTTLVIERMESFGMSVGREVLDTVLWSGRFQQAWIDAVTFKNAAGIPQVEFLARREIKLALCNTSQAKDAQVRAALIDGYGPGKEKAIGRRKQPGPLYGLTGHMWAALAVGVVWAQKEAGLWKPAALGRWLTEAESTL